MNDGRPCESATNISTILAGSPFLIKHCGHGQHFPEALEVTSWLDESDRKISDAIDAYEKSMMNILFPDRYKRGHIIWNPSKTERHMGWECRIFVYDWQFATLHAHYIGGP